MNVTCPIHNVPMYEKEGQYGVFFSHKTDDPDYEGQKGYCNGKKAKGTTTSSSGYQAFKAVGESLAHRAPEVREPVAQEERSRRIERQHSQEMALRYLTATKASEFDITDVKELTEWFQEDLEK